MLFLEKISIGEFRKTTIYQLQFSIFLQSWNSLENNGNIRRMHVHSLCT